MPFFEPSRKSEILSEKAVTEEVKALFSLSRIFGHGRRPSATQEAGEHEAASEKAVTEEGNMASFSVGVSKGKRQKDHSNRPAFLIFHTLAGAMEWASRHLPGLIEKLPSFLPPCF